MYGMWESGKEALPLESKVKLYEAELLALRSTRYTLDSIVGVSDAIASLKAQALKAAASHFPVLISGESGHGKELFPKPSTTQVPARLPLRPHQLRLHSQGPL
jgi:transcriptional regulator with PAS, ATPase and Fis domain